jgi:hypothetical protein
MSYYDWDSEYATFSRVASESHVDALSDEAVRELLDRAASSARAGNLRGAAIILEQLRRSVVSTGLFKSWDNGIWSFLALITSIRRMSSETVVPPEYQRFLDAAPRGSIFTDWMTAEQKTFWYGD